MTFGIIGYGQFGRFMALHLEKHGEVRSYDTNQGGTHTLQDVCATDVLIFAVPVQSLEHAALAAAPYVSEEARIVDVSSVKVAPLAILNRVLPNHRILGTHPIFGPQSGKNGITGLPIVLTNHSFSDAEFRDAKVFLESLGLHVLERTADAHDMEMARVQGLAHFIGRALKGLDIEDYATATKSYRHLLELRDLLKDDSWELFQTIQNENPHAKRVRDEFLAELNRLESLLDDNLA